MELRIVVVNVSQINGYEGSHPAVTMHNVRSPPEFLYGFNYAPGEEQCALVVVFKFTAGRIADYMLSLEIVVIVNEINLHPGRLY